LLTAHDSGEKWCPAAELLLFCADRVQHIEAVIMPALASGKIVVLDRFEDSTRAYQGAQGIPENTLSAMRQLVLKGLAPDLTLLFDADPEMALQRVSGRNIAAAGFQETRFDDEKLDFHKRVGEAFLKIATHEPERVCVIDADGTPESIFVHVWHVVKPRLEAAGFLKG
jgi:dTMP kinase